MKAKKAMLYTICAILILAACAAVWFLIPRNGKKKNEAPGTESVREEDKEESGKIELEDDSLPEKPAVSTDSTEKAIDPDDYYGRVYYTDQTDLEDPSVTISNMDELNYGLLGDEIELNDAMQKRAESRLTSFAMENGIHAAEARVLRFIPEKAGNAGGMRTLYGIEYDDPAATHAVLIIYPDDPLYGMFMDVMPESARKELFVEEVWDDSMNAQEP